MRFGKKSRSVDVSGVAKVGRYIQRAAQDHKVLDRGRVAIDSSRSAYRRIRKQRSSALVLVNDKKLQKELGRAVEAVRDASSALSAAASTKRSRGQLVLDGAILGLIAAVVIAFVWRGKVRSAPGNDDRIGSHSSAETDDSSAMTASPARRAVGIGVPPSSTSDTTD
jgi:hypothetical protein